MKKLPIIYAKPMNHYKYNHQKVFSGKFDEQFEGDQVLDEIGLYNKLKINQNFTKSDIDNLTLDLK